MKFVECPVVERVPARTDVLYTGHLDGIIYTRDLQSSIIRVVMRSRFVVLNWVEVYHWHVVVHLALKVTELRRLWY